MTEPRQQAPAPPPISAAEHRRRVTLVQARMAELELDALFITSEDNYCWLTGFDAPMWQNLTRPRYCIVAARGDPILNPCTVFAVGREHAKAAA